MKLPQRIELLHRSSQRMMDVVKKDRDATWWAFMRRESWTHLKRAIEVWWAILRKKEGTSHTLKAKLLSYCLWPFNIIVKECPWCHKLTGFKKGGRGCTGGMCHRCYLREMAKVKEGTND